jgi:hypothetical protein
MSVRLSPTFSAIAQGSRKRPPRGQRRSRSGRRAKPTEPQIFVATKHGSHGPRFAHAHLRNRGGYVYLTWRDGDRVRTFYLGKAPRSALRPGPSSHLVRTSAAGAGGAGGLRSRRAKRGVS